MTEEQYLASVLARNSGQFHPELVDAEIFLDVLNDLSELEPQLDAIKKALVYGRTDKYLEQFVEVDMPLSPELAKHSQLIHALIGHITESLELAGALTRLLAGELDTTNILEEFGDANWYRVLGLHALGQTETQNRRQNERKLEVRFGPVFSNEAELHRALSDERKVLEEDDGARS